MLHEVSFVSQGQLYAVMGHQTCRVPVGQHDCAWPMDLMSQMPCMQFSLAARCCNASTCIKELHDISFVSKRQSRVSCEASSWLCSATPCTFVSGLLSLIGECPASMPVLLSRSCLRLMCPFHQQPRASWVLSSASRNGPALLCMPAARLPCILSASTTPSTTLSSLNILSRHDWAQQLKVLMTATFFSTV